jgi:hypothetical protein
VTNPIRLSGMLTLKEKRLKSKPAYDDENENMMIDRDSEVLSNKERKEKEENLIYDNKYDEDSNSFQCVIDGCSVLGTNMIGVSTDSEEDYLPYFVCDKHYHELMTGYYKKKNNNNNNNSRNMMIINQAQ